MKPRVRFFLVNAGMLLFTALLIGGVFALRLTLAPAPAPEQTASAAAPISSTSSPNIIAVIGSSMPKTVATSTPKTAPVAKESFVGAKGTPAATNAVSSSPNAEASRIENPYPIPAESVDEVNSQTRAALVNILCTTPGGSVQSISGSGVIIDKRGLILTNAHVAQYVLLSQNPQFRLSCVARTGSPAGGDWTISVIYIPSLWVSEHAQDINSPHPTGTGEHDYAFLRITGAVGQTPLPSSFPFLPIDAREGIGFLGDQILVASYPAELIGPQATEEDLYADTSVSTVQQLLTFGTNTIDVISLGGVIEAQEGSSGGAVTNAWGYLIGLITTTSEGTTTADRDLRAITTSYIDRDLTAQTGQDLQSFLAQDPVTVQSTFDANTAPGLISQYVQVLQNQ